MSIKDGKGDARDLVQCSICLEPFRDPKCLPCIHTFCLVCLETYGKDERPGDEMACPTCRQVFRIPADGFKNLPNNIFIQQITESLETHVIQNRSSCSEMLCEGCKILKARNYCVECKESMCEACSVTHGNLKATCAHKIILLKKTEESPMYMRVRTTYCDNHKDKQLEFYCHDCNKAICHLCSAVEHRTHLRADLQSASNKFSDELKSGLGRLKESIEVIATYQELLEKNKSNLLEQISVCEREIQEQGVELKRLVDMQCNKLLSQLERVKNTEMKKIEIRKEETQRQLLIIKSLTTRVEELTTKGSHLDVAQGAKDLLARGKVLQTAQAEFGSDNLRPDRAIFEPTPIPDIFSCHLADRLIGLIQIKENFVSAEKEFIVIGLSDGYTTSQRVGHISLKRPDSVNTINSTFAFVGNGAAACLVGNTLYAVGIGRSYDELWKWNAASDWLRCADMTSCRRGHSVSVVYNTLYALGGTSGVSQYDTTVTLSNVEAYSTATNKWSAVGQLTRAIHSAACAFYKYSIYMFGGVDANSTAVADVQLYNAAQHNCTLLHDEMPRAYGAMRAVVWETSAILLGCYTCFIFNFETQTWQERDSFKTDVAHFGLVIDQDTLYIAGGGTTDNRRVWKCTDEVRSVSVRDVIENKGDVIEDKRGARWKHHARLPQPALIHAFTAVPLSSESDM